MAHRSSPDSQDEQPIDLSDPWAPDYPIQRDDLLSVPWKELNGPEKRRYRQFNKANWSAFPSTSGTHIRRERAGARHRYNLVTDDRTILATVQDGHAWPTMIMLRSVDLDGHTYQVRVEGSRKSADAELIDCSSDRTLLRVVGRHYGGEQSAIAAFSDQRRFHFPILGGGLFDEVMTAVDQEGAKIVRYRQAKSRTTQTRSAAKIEAVINPAHRVTSDLLLLIAISSGFLLTEYRARPGG